ncbi:MAG: GNAT superfamily N-acetyltransferase [Planctomycetota bacterium]|jgi:GNAT superfamily N-acetyltransferase
MIQLRQISAADLPRVSAIFCEAFGVKDAPPIDYFANLCYTDPEGCLVGTVDGEIVGYACTHQSGSVGYMGTLAVSDSCRGMGYGKALTLATRDHLAANCEVVGLSVEPTIGRNLELYTACGFEPSLPACHVGKRLAESRTRAISQSIQTAQQLGANAESHIAKIGEWSAEVFPGLDMTRDLEFFVRNYPERLWIHADDKGVNGFLAYDENFRGDPWGMVRPGPNDLDVLTALIEAIEASTSNEILWFQLHTNFRRALRALRARGYRVADHKTCMVFEEQAGSWPSAPDSLLIRPWWT